MPLTPKSPKGPSLRTTDAPAHGDVASLVGHTIEVDPNRIHINPERRVRAAAPDQAALMAKFDSIRKFGQIMPIVVCPSATVPGAFELVAGETRHGAILWMRNGNKHNPTAKADEKITIRATVIPNVSKKGNTKEQALDNYATAYRENADHNMPTALDQVHTYKILRENFKADSTEAKKILGCSDSQLTLLKELDKCDPRVKELLNAGHISMKRAAETVGLDEETITRVLATIQQSFKEIERAIPMTEKIMENEREKAKVEAARDRAKTKASAATVTEARKNQPKGKSRAGRPASQSTQRSISEIMELLAGVFTSRKTPANVKKFVTALRDYIGKKADEKAVAASLVEEKQEAAVAA